MSSQDAVSNGAVEDVGEGDAVNGVKAAGIILAMVEDLGNVGAREEVTERMGTGVVKEVSRGACVEDVDESRIRGSRRRGKGELEEVNLSTGVAPEETFQVNTEARGDVGRVGGDVLVDSRHGEIDVNGALTEGGAGGEF